MSSKSTSHLPAATLQLPALEAETSDANDRQQDIAIQIDDLAKCYPIYDKPRDRLVQMITRGRKKLFREFWALRNVSFTVHKGETVGIIGQNGSGKSTLLQMICGTLNPTSGQITVNGKVAALLELGAGFNPEFTGRENVYMAASLYSLTKAEIDSRFGSIAKFADIGDHLEQPVKTYSSGMYVRLAFAVIAHVDADILVIDEALAVGDAIFTQKCMRFIRQFQKAGTLLFVSHDMGSVLSLCKKAVWLGNGEIRQMGEAKAISEAYLQYTLQQAYGDDSELSTIKASSTDAPAPDIDTALLDAVPRPLVDYQAVATVQNNLTEATGWKTGSADIIDVRLHNLTAPDASVLCGGERVKLHISARINEDLTRPILGFIVKDRLGQDLFGENTLMFTNLNPMPVSSGQVCSGDFIFTLPMLPNGQYSVVASIADGDLHSNVQHHFLHDALIINVSSSKVRWGLVGINFEHVSLSAT